MTRQRIYVVQFGTGASINLLPLAAGQLYSRLLVDEAFPMRSICRRSSSGVPATRRNSPRSCRTWP
jgi:hypothetical protein